MPEPFLSAARTGSVAVGFDFDHTLGIDNKLERTVGVEMLLNLAREGGCDFDREEAMRAVDAALAAFRSSPMSLEDALRQEFEQVACRGADYVAAIARFRASVVERAPAFIEALPGAHELLASLDHAGIPYAMLTNGWSPLQEEKARLIGFRGRVIVSDVIGAWKPSPQAFETLVTHFALPAERVWYVGDDPAADCAGAKRAGLISVWFDWENKVYPTELPQPHYRVRRLAELAELLPGCAPPVPKPA